MDVSYTRDKVTGRAKRVHFTRESFDDERILDALVEFALMGGKIVVETPNREITYTIDKDGN